MTRGNDASFLDRIKKTEIGKLICTKDWSSSPLVNIEHWPASFRTTLTLCLTTPLPVATWWGKELVLIYNDAFRNALGINDAESFNKNGRNLAGNIDKDLRICCNILEEGKVSQCDKKFTLSCKRGNLEQHIQRQWNRL